MMTRREWSKTAAAAAAVGWLGACSPTKESSSGEQAGPAPAGAAGDLLARSIVIDMHIDTPGRMIQEGIRLGARGAYQQVDIPRMREGGLTAGFFAVYTSATDKTPLEAVKKGLEVFDAVVEEVRRYPDDLFLATTADDIVRAKRENKIAILIGVEGGHMIDSSLPVLRDLYRLGARYLGLTHSAPTAWAGSAESPEGPKGLTDFGKEIVREMNRLGMMIDLAHASDQTFYDCIETSKAPIMNSHACCRAVANYPRNLTDDMLKALAGNGGVLHIAFYNGLLLDGYGQADLKDLEEKRAAASKELAGDPERLSAELYKLNQQEAERLGPVPLSVLLDHFEHAVTVAGIDHVGFGSDFDAVRHRVPQGMEDISKMPNLVAGLQERGFTDPDIEKILGGNSLRMMREVERVAAEA